ncbi:uncharacterized protein LOC123561547 [Mercenaria mercenaria]|uniref:uncharacterized protein LOC123561547 n=1 Tax=Mercenaria mercenaria TaxID=6596 RepID=UPI00234EC924|nr:uncharacterized protein LOC123561547 [Mercenaria mercenaria]XP_053381341.1 uncharacterized protein LOC123561547 [Mercenaria mercenaria]XP_053381342.1 uncharacterized protein LOC123561547 [Mercenaria mercenaria]
MTHQDQLANVKYRNWVRGGLGIKYVKEGLEPFCDHLATQQHIYILNKVQQAHNLLAVSCGQCDVRTLQPNHVRTKNNQCPLGQTHCNCLRPGGKTLCPSNVCGAIYDEIIQLHASTPPAPYWKNTDARQWCTEPWSVAKCFINAPGYEQKTKASEFDCLGLLHVLINNKGFQQHIKCQISGTDVFSRVRKSRNNIFHSHTMELADSEVNSYICDMIELLEDEREIKHRQETKDAVKRLQELKQNEFVISTKDEAEIHRVVMAAIDEKEKELKQTIADAGNKLKSITDEGKHDIEEKGLVIESELELTGQKITRVLVTKEDEIKTTAIEGKHDIEGKGVVIKSELEQIGLKIGKELVMREDEPKKAIEQRGIEIEKQLTRKAVEAEEKLEQKLQESKLHLENHKTLIEWVMTSTAETIKEDGTSRVKTDFQDKLVRLYEKHVRKVPQLPRLHKNKMHVSDMYVSPWMTVEEMNEESNDWKQVKISMHQIFRNNERATKYIYVIGEAGSGKTTFCKILVHFWCVAHSFQECSLDERDIMKEMKRFDFLFFVSLRNYPDCDAIENMLKKSYGDPALGGILQNDSGKCLIVLDGLDEWIPEKKPSSQFLTPGLPGRELDADYTIITTSRQWKFDALPISDNEVDKKIKLNGIDRYQIRALTEKTVETLNDICKVRKRADNCITDLQSRHLSEICHTPLILQQLICLWYNGKLQDNSKCAIYGSMLDLFLEWKALGTLDNQKPLFEVERDRKRTKAIQHLSHLAHETLFDKNKENTLEFSILTLARLSIPDDVIRDCLNSGILKQELNVSLCESKRSSISFFHKSVQEYLAAVYIASQFREMLNSQEDEHGLKHVCKKCVEKYFGSCKTAVDILEQSNVFVMLCGLEPRLLTDISKYIYSTVFVDKMVIEERNTFPKKFFSDHHKLIKDIQTCIFMCIEEVMSIAKNVHSPVYIADIYVSHSMDLLRYCHNIILQNVQSIAIEKIPYSMIGRYNKNDKKTIPLALQNLAKCEQLKVMKFETDYHSEDLINNEISIILEANVHTLETVSLLFIEKRILTRIVSILPKMRQLTSLHVKKNIYAERLPHDGILSLGKFLDQNTNLQHITLDIDCEKYDKHMIDLSKHKQLQYVDFETSTFCTVNCNTDNLETCMLRIARGAMMKQVCNCLYKAYKLKHLDLYHTSYIEIDEAECKTVTDNLIRLLPSLIGLSTLTLGHFTFTDNIIARPRDMRNLKEIILYGVEMSLTTWCKFIDSLPVLPQVVKVTTTPMVFRDWLFGFTLNDEMKIEAAQQYVKEKTNLFHVTLGRTYRFQFTTQKV